MKKQDLSKSLRGKRHAELLKELEDSYVKIRELQFDLATKKIKNYKEIKLIKKKIAFIMTILKEEEAKGDTNG